ncbi:Acyl-CoA dehydrogenase, C-terminal domain [Micromonospora citrea]|uniref:Acyl-CoA dehydrogenase, C-terminal domain n=1 Tax=Micromonospora citrea TaxID=47855 RepID=A0A1C6VZ67_9ACTN|nr:acyl-CoA dehydrogenase family protein [Micromonospora citrea]SCL71586.1 Acyl-CoA dehydrogenase, C-terminal domain [Micromonospora citrea]
MDFRHDETTERLRGRLLAFMAERVYPAEPAFEEQVRARADPWAAPPVVAELQAEARRRGLWNLFLPGGHPGVTVRRGLRTFGYDDGDHGGHAEIDFVDVRVPAGNLIGAEGDGFAISQARLGPGRVHHCMRLLGMAERALELMCRRVGDRNAFGAPLAEQGVIRDWIAEARVRVEQARLLVLKTAWLMDTVGNRAAHTEIQAIKIAVPATVEWVIDRAIQAHGAAGLSQDTPLAGLWVRARALRLADGPDEVHRQSLARRELRRHQPDRDTARV